MKSHRSRMLLLMIAVLFAAVPSLSALDHDSAEDQIIIKASPSEMDALIAEYGLTVESSLHANGRSLYLVQAAGMDAQQLADWIGNDARVLSFKAVEIAALRKNSDSQSLLASPADALDDVRRPGKTSAPCLSAFVENELWNGYADQRLIPQINLRKGHNLVSTLGCGGATVAIIDTGVDPTHPVLRDALIPGYDFLLEEAGVASEWTNLDQSISAIVEQSISAIVEQSISAIVEGDEMQIALNETISPILDQSISAIVEGYDELPESFGHGTMVAGFVRLVAPGARIMPLKVFNADGKAHLFNILRAIYFAVDNGADVINMSFSMSELDHEFREAIRYARSQGVVVVAAAGNQGQSDHVYPAALTAAIGVASVELDDTLSSFSNYGSDLALLAAPGSSIISTYPGGLFAVGWGTSFSAPLVAGTAALFHRRPANPQHGQEAVQRARQDIRSGTERFQPLSGMIGSGRLDVEETLWKAAQ